MRVLAILLLLWPASAMADVVRDWIDAQPEAYQTFLNRVASNSTMSAYAEMCPADVFSARGSRPTGSQDCENAPGWCLTQCNFGNGDACFGAARAIQTELDDPGDANLTFPLFMAACADGNANGCTNAGAAAKNGSWLEGTRPSTANTRECQYRTYNVACKRGATWGCFMLGMQWGFEGVQGVTDMEKARSFWRRSCELGPDSSACQASTRRLDAN